MGFRILLGIAVGLPILAVNGVGQEQVEIPAPLQSWIDQVMGFLYTFAHWIGQVVSDLIVTVWPDLKLPAEITDTVGFLAVLTVFLVVTEVAKKLAWIVLAVAWILVLVRVVMLFFPAAQ